MAGIQIVFSVPQFPEFRYGLGPADVQRYEMYMTRFLSYATTSVAAQVGVSTKCMNAGGFVSQKVEIENLVKDVRLSMDAIAERSALCVGAEMQEVVRAVEDIKKNMVEKVVSSEDVVENGRDDENMSVSEKTLRNRQWRLNKKLKKQRRQGHVAGLTASTLRLSVEKKWEAENKVAAKRAEQVYDTEFDPCFVSNTRAMSKADVERKIAQDKAETARLNKLAAKYEKQLVDGTVDRELAAHKALLEGRISGKYAFNSPSRVVGFAKTVSSGSSKSTGTVWSGSGASGKTRNSSLGSEGPAEEVFLRRANDMLERKVQELEKKVKVMMESDDGYETPAEGCPGNF